MSYQASNIIKITTRMRAGGLAYANFASVVLFAPQGETPSTMTPGTFKTYATLSALSQDFLDDTETYKAAERYLGAIPRPRQLIVYVREEEDTSWTETLNKARNKRWWYVTLMTETVYNSEDDVMQVAQWCESNESLFVNNVSGEMAEAVRDENTNDDIASKLTARGFRHTFTATHATDPYSGNALLAHFTAVNYLGENTTITGFGKKSPGLLAEELDENEYAAMESDKKKSAFYSFVELQGSNDPGRWLNTTTHSTYNEQIDDIVNLDAFVNHVKVSLYNTIMGVTTKLPQTTIGQAQLIGALEVSCEQYITNGYLGERHYLNPDTGQEDYTRGYEILTVPEAILDLTNEERDARLSAPLRIRVFRAGAIEGAIVDIDIL